MPSALAAEFETGTEAALRLGMPTNFGASDPHPLAYDPALAARNGPIVVATDLSPAADVAIQEADRRARAADAQLIVCHVLPDLASSAPLFPQRHAEADLALPALTERALATVGERVAELTGRIGGHVEIRLLNGAPETSIVDLAEQTSARLLVVGSHGTSGVAQMLLGSVSEVVVRSAHCSVLVVRLHRPVD